MGKKSVSGMNNPNHISESLEKLFCVKILKFYDADPGYEMKKIRIRDKHPGSATLFIGFASKDWKVKASSYLWLSRWRG